MSEAATVEEQTTQSNETQDNKREDNQKVDKSQNQKTTHDLVSEAVKELKEKKEIEEKAEAQAETEEMQSSDNDDAETEEKPKDKNTEKQKSEEEQKQEQIKADKKRLREVYGDHDVDHAPAKWKKEAREAWKDIPLAARYAIRENMNSQSAYIEKQDGAFKKFESLVHEWDGVRDSVKNFAKMSKTDEKTYINGLINADKVAHEDPLRYLVNFANAYQIDLRELVNGGVAFDSRLHKEQYHKSTAEVENERLREENERLRNQQNQQVQYQQQQYEDQGARYVQNFLDNKDQNEVQLVLPTFGFYVSQVKSEGFTQPDDILDEAYTRALNSSLEHYAKIQQQKDDAKLKKHQEELERAEKARGFKSNGASHGRPNQKHFTSIRDAVTESYRQAANKRRY